MKRLAIAAAAVFVLSTGVTGITTAAAEGKVRALVNKVKVYVESWTTRTKRRVKTDAANAVRG
jgi:hypothetical protein